MFVENFLRGLALEEDEDALGSALNIPSLSFPHCIVVLEAHVLRKPSHNGY